MRAAPGVQLGAGRLRVDATKAIAKLREYQLVDRTAWILEAIRAAVAAGATAIDLQGDSNDVWLSWAGTPWPAEDLPQLFDELVSPEPGVSRHHVRLLAAAVNSALGANPAYVDVYAISEAGAVRARFTPDVLETPGELEESPLRNVKTEPTAIPPGAPVGMHVHFRRRASLEVVSYWLRRADPPELVMARSACADIATPIRIGDETYDRSTNPRDVIRVPLGDDIDGWIAITEKPHGTVELAIAERGVLLEQATTNLALFTHGPIPVRVVIDAPRLPTNASRSEVRRDTHPVSTGERRARELVPALIERLVEQCADPRARRAAIYLLASVIAGADWPARAREVAAPLRALAELPLVRDAAGVPRPVCWNWSGLVHAGSAPLSPELAPWLGHVLWAPPDDPTCAIVNAWADPDALARHVRAAKQARRAERRFYKHAQREPRVLGKRKPRVRARLGAPLAGSCIPDAMFDGFTGEVCIYGEPRGSELTILLGGREIETIELDSAIPFAAVIDSERITPGARFRSVVRDDAYAALERAMRAGVVRALEAVAAAHAAQFFDGYHVAVGRTIEDDASLLKSGLYLTRNLGARGGFERAPIWRTTSGYRATAELRAQVIGVVPPHTVVPPLDGRLVVYADELDRRLLAELSSQLVAYEPRLLLEGRISAQALAAQIMGTEPHALAIDDGDVIAAIVPSPTARLLIHHRGRLLADGTYEAQLAPATIAVDSDRVVPTADWDGVADDAGLAARDYASYEHLLAREAVRALLGERSPSLLGGDAVELASALGRWLCQAASAAVLGEELARRLELASLFRVLGEDRRFSIAELAVLFPDTITYVTVATEPVPGFPALVADHPIAQMIARIANRQLRDGEDELAKRRTQLAHELRLGMHRAKPPVPLEVAGTHLAIRNALGHGVIGCGRDVLEIQVLVEGRLFQTITRVEELPLACVFELADTSLVDERFEALIPDTIDRLISNVRARCPELLRTIAEQWPEALADAGPRRALFAAFANRFPLSLELRELLVRSVLFPTVQGARARILEARRASAIAICTWTGEWLPADGPGHALDGPVLQVSGAPELQLVLSALGNLVDVTRDIERLQTQRRIARGLLPTPRCIGTPPELTRALTDLSASLGPGEIALVPDTAEVLVHVSGELRERISLDCLPAIQLAIEAADLVGDRAAVDKRIVPEARRLAALLVQRILAQREPHALSADIRATLRRAVIANALALPTAALFETIDGSWLDLAAVHAQRALFGNVWCVAERTDARPIDTRRSVLRLTRADQALANEHGLSAIDATLELELDAKTRRNQRRPLADSLAISDVGLLAKVELVGDGTTTPRGWVGVLSPSAAHHRSLQLHRAMHPFDRAPDPCRWPTIAKLDDARFTPDRCWEQPERDEIFKAAIDALHRASNDALRALAQAPATALASIRVAPWTYDAVTLLRTGEAQFRGTVWLDGPPIPAVSTIIHIIEAGGSTQFVPLRGLGLAGTIFVHATRPWDREVVLEALCKSLHAKLVRELAIAQHRRTPDLVTAHLAWALALERITPEDARGATFACFRPLPLDAKALTALLLGTNPVTLVTADSPSAEPALVDDGSETSRVIRTWLAGRLRAPSESRARPETRPPPAATITHPLQPFVERLHARILDLGIEVPRWRLVDGRTDPVARYAEDVTLELAADNRHVIATAAACAADTAWSSAALDAIAAHCVTVMNVALAAITDATEARAISRLLDD